MFEHYQKPLKNVRKEKQIQDNIWQTRTYFVLQPLENTDSVA